MTQSIEEIFAELIPSDEVWNQKYSIDAFTSICNQINAVRNKNGQIFQAIYKGYSEADNIPQKYKRRFLDFHEKFYGEILPLLTIVTRKFNDDRDILIKYTGSTNSPYDAEIYRLSDNDFIQRIEFTGVIDGESVPAFKEHMKKFGCAPGVPGIPGSIKPYEKDAGLQKQPIQAGYAAQSDEILCQFIQEAILKKQKEKYTGFWLGVVFFDWQCIFDDAPFDKQTEKYRSYFRHILKQLNPEISLLFTRVFFIGSSLGYFDEIDPKDLD